MKSHFLSQKLIFHCLQKSLSIKVDFFFHFRSHERSKLLANYYPHVSYSRLNLLIIPQIRKSCQRRSSRIRKAGRWTLQRNSPKSSRFEYGSLAPGKMTNNIQLLYILPSTLNELVGHFCEFYRSIVDTTFLHNNFTSLRRLSRI